MMKVFENSQFGSIRTLVEDGKPLFCGNDVARALGFSCPKDTIRERCKGAVKRRIPTDGGGQEMNFIPESDLYRLAFQSKLPGAVKFTDWVTEEVLPAIRETGNYLPAKCPLEPDTQETAPPALALDDNSLSGIVQVAVRSTLSEVMPFVRARRRSGTPNEKTTRGAPVIGIRIDPETLERLDRACYAKGQTRTDLVLEGIRRILIEVEEKAARPFDL